MTRLFARALAIVLLSGCQLLNKPGEPMRFQPDAGPADAGTDARPSIETACNDGMDNDMDRLTDCVDYDCAPTADCCAIAPDVAVFDWTAAPGTQFYSFATAPQTGMCSTLGTDQCVTSFGSGTAMIRRCRGTECEDQPVCDPLAAGYSVTATFIPKGTSTSFASIVLTPAPELQSGTTRLLDDLAVNVLQNGDVEVTQARTVIGRAAAVAGADRPITVKIVIGPSSEGGRSVLRATVTATGATTPVTVVDRYPFLLASDLVRDDGCEEIGGLYFGIEGEGAGVFLGEVSVTELECTNPSAFTVPENIDQRAVLVTHDEAEGPLPATHVDLGFDAWSYGGIASPSLLRVDPPGPPPEQWDLFVDATDVGRSAELFANIGFSIGRAQTTSFDDWGAWSVLDDPRDPGSCHPSCVAPPVAGCECGESIREPAFVDGCSAWAQASIGVPAPVYTIRINGNPETTFDDPECDAERDPALAPMGPGAVNHWLFYTCERAGMPSHIRVVEIDCRNDLTMTGANPFGSADLGPFAAGGIRAPEILATVRPGDTGPPAVYSMWFLARDLASRVTIGLALAQAAEGMTPAFTPYPANPVLPHANVRQDVACTDCRITGLAVAPLGMPANSLRFLLARSVDDSSTTRDELVPLDQAWSNPYGPSR